MNMERAHHKQVDIDAKDFRFTHDDSGEYLFAKETLGKISFHSGWDLANIFRYGVVANQLVHIKRQTVNDVVEVLDVGSSAANFYTFWMSSYANPGRPRVSYTGLEVRQEQVDRAAELFPGIKKSVNSCKVLQRDVILNPLSVADGKFNVIVMQEVLEHLPVETTVAAIKASYDMLKPGGTVIISSPNPKKHLGREFQYVWEDSHVYEYALWEMLKHIADAGFVVIDIKGWLGKSRNLKKQLNQQQRILYDELQSVSTGLATSIIALTNPELAECYTIVCKKPEDIKEKELQRVKEKYAKYAIPMKINLS